MMGRRILWVLILVLALILTICGSVDATGEAAPTGEGKSAERDPADAAGEDGADPGSAVDPGNTADADSANQTPNDPETAESDSATLEDSDVPADGEGKPDAAETDGAVAAGKEAAAENEELSDDEGDEAIPAGKEPSTSKTPVPKSASGDDLSPTGNCTKDIAAFCKDVSPGPSALVNCLGSRLKAEKTANDDKGLTVSADCKNEIRAFKIEMYKDITMDKKMETACKTDITKFCDDDFLYPEPGNILACLREVNQVDTVSEGCKEEIVRAQQDAANDFKMDPQLDELCSGEAERLCKDVTPGEGRIQNCLRANRQKLAWDCQAELFRQEVENVADIRLNVRLFRGCLNDKKKFCPDIVPGDARVKDCLEEHRDDPDFSPQCKEEFDKMMERRASDFRLDPSLRKFCKSDISEICYPDAEDITDVASWDAKVIQCLQDYRDELKDPKCRQQVRQLTKRAAEDIRFDKPFADACHSDRTTVCKDVPDGMAQVLRCLQDHRDKLKEVCRSALFDQEVRMAEEIDFDFSMKKACVQETKVLCKDVPEGHAAVIKCLQEKLEEPDMGAECKTEIKRNELRWAEDYRLNYRLNKACFNDVQKMCLHSCEKALEGGSVTCGGTVLKCLSANKSKIQSEACKKEVFAFEKQEVSDIRLDVPLQAACTGDLDKMCPSVSKDHSRTLACLRSNRDNLTEECKAEELRFSEMEASDIRLTPTLMNACGQELQIFCREAPPTDGQAFKCLQEHLEDVGMGAACKAEVNLQEARHSSNYRLDVRVRKECEADVDTICPAVDKGQEGHALVLKCFVSNYKKLSGSCATEVGYSVRMALWQYKIGAELTQACDPVVEAKCQSEDAKPIGGSVIGVYGQCLLEQKWATLTPDCKKLVQVAAKEGGHVGGQIDEGKLQETIEKLAALQALTNSQGGGGGLVLSGWMAFAAVISLVVVILGLGYGVYKKYYSPTRNYTMVVKAGDV